VRWRRIKPDDNKQPAAGLVIMAPPRGDSTLSCVLLLRRSNAIHNPHLWNLPGGRVEPGETPVEAAYREAAEEAGFNAATWGAFPTPFWTLELPLEGVAPYTYVGTSVPKAVQPTLNFESDAFLWVNPREALKLPMRSELREGLLHMIRVQRGLVDPTELMLTSMG